MNNIVKQIAKNQDVLESHVQHLANNPVDFLALVKVDILLAQRYAQAFSAGHALTLFSKAQEQGIKLATKIFSLDPDIDINIKQINLRSYNHDQLRAIAIEMIRKSPDLTHNETETYYSQYNRTITTQRYYFCSSEIFNIVSHSEDGSLQFNFKRENREYFNQFEIAYNHYLHRVLVSDLKNELLTDLLSKLDSSVFLTDTTGKRVGIMDAEFTQQSTFSRHFSTSENLIDQLVEHEHYGAAGKIISLLSPVLAMRELQRPRLGNTNLMAMFIEQIPNTPQPTAHAIEKMRSLPARFFESFIAGFTFNVLEQIKSKCEKLANAFYHLAPSFMQRQYPRSVESFVEVEMDTFQADLPQPYKPV